MRRDRKPDPDFAGHVVRELAAHALEAVVTMDADGILTGWNQQAEALFGWAAHEVVGRPMHAVIIPERYREAHRAGLARYRITRRGKIVDSRTDISALHRDGHEIGVEVSVTALAEAGGVTFVGFLRDVTRHRELETALRDSEARFAGVIHQLPGIAYVDRVGGGCLYVSPKVDDILGYTTEEWLADDRLWSNALHPDDRERALGLLRAGEASGGSFSSVYRLVARDGRVVWIRDQATVHRDGDGERRVSGVMFDITRERGAEAALELAVAERAEIAESLRRIPNGRPAHETALAICRELQRIPHLDVAAVYEFSHDGTVTPIGELGPAGAPASPDRPLVAPHAAYLRESATGPWIDEWTQRLDDVAHRQAWLDLGLTCCAYVPFGAGGETFGLLAAGTTAPIGAAGVSRWLPSLTEFGAVAAALLVPELSDRRREAGARAAVRRIVETEALSPVFQPIVRLGDGSAVGFEALTRFADGVPPERHFAAAEAVGAGQELERAAIAAAAREAAQLPAGAWLSVNLSPSRLTEPGMLEHLRAMGQGGRPVVVEVTERLAIEDYELVRAALDQLAGSVEVAVDDAGAGFASLRHILELRPRYVKLDIQLVRGVDADPARQALIAGMVYFARESGCLLVAEGIEAEAERATLRRLGVPFGQGFLFGYPAPAATFAAAPGAAVRGANASRRRGRNQAVSPRSSTT